MSEQVFLPTEIIFNETDYTASDFIAKSGAVVIYMKGGDANDCIFLIWKSKNGKKRRR